jgi:hypothetical protein
MIYLKLNGDEFDHFLSTNILILGENFFGILSSFLSLFLFSTLRIKLIQNIMYFKVITYKNVA